MDNIKDIELTLKPIISADQIQSKVQKMGVELSQKFKDKAPLMICTLKGAMFFYADLIRAMDIALKCDFVKAYSYFGGTTAKDDIVVDADITTKVKDEHVILVDEIVDRGKTLSCLQKLVTANKPKSLCSVALLSKPDCRIEEVEIDMVGFTIPDEFVVGYGMDYQGYFRNLPYVAVSDHLK